MLKRILVAIAALLVMGIATTLFVLWRSVPPLSGTERVPGLGAEVTVRFDSLGVPHIRAASDADAFRALGYLHARDRLWQMETLRRAAQGRLSEVFGGSTVSTDRFLRSLDITWAAERSLALMPAETRALLDAYVAGINAWIAARPRPLPPEFQVLRFKPEPWTARQVYGVARIMSWDLAQATTELGLARAAARVGTERVTELFPWYPPEGAVILAPGTYTCRGCAVRRAPYAGRASLPSYLLAESSIPEIPPLAAEVLSAVAMTRASNSWVIGPSLSTSGRPILANDPHLELRAPALWYLVAIESPGFQVIGATTPGLPAVILGHNRRIAWGWTNVEADDVDYVIERLTPDSSLVLTTSGLQPVGVRWDTIRVRGGAGVPYALRRTSHGPLVPRAGVAGPPRDGMVEAVAMRWNAHEPSDELTAILMLDRAGSWADVLAAASRFKSPEQNWVYADVDGNIGYAVAGAFPVRRSGAGLLPTPGWTDEGRWERYLDFEELPRALNPPEGFIVTANNRTAGPEYPWEFTKNWAMPYRAQRIRQLLGEDAPTHRRTDAQFDADDVARMQMDTLDLFAAWAKGIAADAAERAGFGEQAAALRAWDGTAGADRTEPTLFHVWYRALLRETFADELGGPMTASSRVHAWMRAGTSPWFDDTRTSEREDLAALAERAMREAVSMAAGRTWGEVHRTIARHALGEVRPLDWAFRLNLGPAPRGGSLYTVNVGDFGGYTPPFVNTHAASMRHVVDMAEPERGRFILTSGQSGNPLSRRYRDQAALWMRGELRTLTIGAPAGSVGELRLVPGGEAR